MLEFIRQGADMVLCTGGMSVDPDDKTPGAIKATGAEIVSYGAPVLPGAMFLLSYYEKEGKQIPVLGLPGCVMYAGRTIFVWCFHECWREKSCKRKIWQPTARAVFALDARCAISRTADSENKRLEQNQEEEKQCQALPILMKREMPIMVDVTDKAVTERTAVASGCIRVNEAVYQAITERTAKKGDVLGTARIAGIMAAKRTWELIPLCHPLQLTKVSIDFELEEESRTIRAFCTTKLAGKTGVEMEALTGVNVALLTIYDMCKAMDRGMEIGEIHLEEKMGGKSGHFVRKN